MGVAGEWVGCAGAEGDFGEGGPVTDHVLKKASEANPNDIQMTRGIVGVRRDGVRSWKKG